MPTTAKILLDSVSDAGVRAITWELRYPRIVHSEFMTHRVNAKNSSSTRAIPVERMIQNIKDDMFVPKYWGKNQKGMQAAEVLTGWRQKLVEKIWIATGLAACFIAESLTKIGLHKQIAGRILEPWSYINVCMTTTSHANFFALRNHKDAQPEIAELAREMWGEFEKSVPTTLKFGDWHLPYVTKEDYDMYDLISLKMISVARCASVSYKTVDGKTMDAARALLLFNKLVGGTPMHASPTEHQLTPDRKVSIDVRPTGTRNFTTIEEWELPELHGCTVGFIQYRKTLPNEYVADPFYYSH